MTLQYLFGFSKVPFARKNFKVRIHRGVTRTTLKHVSLNEDIQSIFPLGNDNLEVD